MIVHLERNRDEVRGPEDEVNEVHGALLREFQRRFGNSSFIIGSFFGNTMNWWLCDWSHSVSRL